MIYPSAPQDFEAECDLSTLERASEVVSDPQRLERAKSFARAKASKLIKLAGSAKDTASAEEFLAKGYRSLK